MYIIQTRWIQIYTHILELAVITVHNSDSEDQFFCIVVVEDAVEIIAETCIYLLCDLLHGKFVICHPLSIQLNSQQPR